MAEVPSKKRRPNFSDEELHAMIAAVQQRKTILLATFGNNVTAKSKNSAWEAVVRSQPSQSCTSRLRRSQNKVQ